MLALLEPYEGNGGMKGLFQVNPKFTCFTGTKVQILTLTRLPGARPELLLVYGALSYSCMRP